MLFQFNASAGALGADLLARSTVALVYGDARGYVGAKDHACGVPEPWASIYRSAIEPGIRPATAFTVTAPPPWKICFAFTATGFPGTAPPPLLAQLPPRRHAG